MEQLVARTGKAEYWNNLLKLSEHASGMRDHDTLDVYRLKLLTGTIAGKDEYLLLAQLALQLGFAAESQAVAASVESSEGVVFVPALTGLGAPHWDPHARGTILGITRGTTRAHLVRATLEAIAFEPLAVLSKPVVLDLAIRPVKA